MDFSMRNVVKKDLDSDVSILNFDAYLKIPPDCRWLIA